MKIYDKDMYKAQEKIQSAVLVIVVFLLGFFAGFMTNRYTGTENKVETQNNVIESNQMNTL